MPSYDLGVNTQPGVQLGFWTNWSRGRVLGATLTLTQKDGAFLIAFLALLVTFVGSRLWRIACYGLHHFLSSRDNQDALYHQRQAILRNSDTAATALLDWLRIVVGWRQNGTRLIQRIGPLAVFTAFMLSAFSVAGIMSSRIASMTGQEVLVKGGSCGVNILGHNVPGQDKNPAVGENEAFFTTLIPFLSQRLVWFSDYAQNCYTSNPDPQQCSTYVKPQLPSTVDRAAGCPFEEDICRLKTGNILIDTGYLNSHHDFGINTPANQRFLYRRTTHCAPLVSEGYKAPYNFSVPGVERQYMQYFYGSSTNKTTNSTYQYPQTSLEEYVFNQKVTRSAFADYTLGYTYVDVINGSIAFDRAFQPIDPLFRSDADVTLVFLSANQVIYPLPVDDPWYSAHQAIPGFRLNFTGWDDLSLQGRFADEPVSTLGCAKQYQICYPDSHGKPLHCSRMGGKQELAYLLASLPQDQAKRNLTEWSIMAALTGNELDGFVQTLGAESLTSRYGLVSGFQGPIPDNQWQTDVEHWHSATLAAIQGSAVDSATGPSNPQMKAFWAPPENEQQRFVCANQKIISSAHTNFSVFGLFFTVVSGGIIIAISVMIDPLIAFYQEHYDRPTYARLEWCTNGTLQLQRLAHEGLGAGNWSRCTKYVPISLDEDGLASYDMSEARHPRLRAPVLRSDDLLSSAPSVEKLESQTADEYRKDSAYGATNISSPISPITPVSPHRPSVEGNRTCLSNVGVEENNPVAPPIDEATPVDTVAQNSDREG